MTAPTSSSTLRRRITRLAIVPITLVALLVLTLTSINHLISERGHLDELSTTLVDLFVKKITVPVFLSDAPSTQAVIDSLSTVPAVLFAEAGNRRTGFTVSYERDDLGEKEQRAVVAAVSRGSGSGLLASTRLESRELRVDDEIIGEFTMVLDTRSLRYTLVSLVYTALLAIGFAVFIGVLLNRVLARRVVVPILELQQAMNRFSISGSRDGALHRTGQREMDDLYDHFEHMAGEIEERDARLQRYSSDLESKVRIRSDELVALNRQRVDWLERMAHFLRHELDNKILGISSTLDRIEHNDETGRFADYVDRGRRTTTQMHRLLEDVAEATGLEAALAAEDKQVLDLGSLVEAQGAGYVEVYPHIRFRVDTESNVPILGNADRLVQLTDNLVANAVEHVGSSNVVSISLRRYGGAALLKVENLGDPLPENCRRLFDLFYSTAAPGGQHRGMGLYIVRLVALDHFGDAWAEPFDDGRGARLVVRLPLYSMGNELTMDPSRGRDGLS